MRSTCCFLDRSSTQYFYNKLKFNTLQIKNVLHLLEIPQVENIFL